MEPRIEPERALEEIFGPGGILEERLPSYEFRPSQQRMAEAVLDAVQASRPLCVEAGTGTGKTLAYLIPALFSRRRVIVSTATKNLQDQIFLKDIPFLRRHLFPDLAATYMKGRHNYLCLRKFRDEISRESLMPGARPEWQTVGEWVRKTGTGDRTELEWLPDEDPLWKQLDARSDNCTGQKCQEFECCFVTRMRQQALESDLVVVNHALFFSNLALENDEIGRVLPDFSILILDEGHEVEDTAAHYFGRQISNYQIEDLCRSFQKVFAAEPEALALIDRIQLHAAAFFAAFPDLEGRHSLDRYRPGRDAPADLRRQALPQQNELQRALATLFHRSMRRSERPLEAEPLIRRLEHLMGTLEALFDLEASGNVYWFERRGRGLFLHANPIDVAPILREKLFQRADTVVVTSATLATGNNFEYVKERLGIPDPRQLIVPGEFDYARQSILYIPRALPEPRSPGYLSRAVDQIRQILEITRGHAFLLFTSFQQMDRVHQALANTSPFPLFRQGERPKNQLLDLFKSTPGSVLCATASFWQGVDVQGDVLRAVVIDKLPFQVPTEPLVAARLRRLQEQGENPFLGYSVPEAIITLRQGLGRLIRSRQDRGLLAILDSRLRTRRYGQVFLESLPEAPLTDRMEDVRRFFNQTPTDRLRDPG